MSDNNSNDNITTARQRANKNYYEKKKNLLKKAQDLLEKDQVKNVEIDTLSNLQQPLIQPVEEPVENDDLEKQIEDTINDIVEKRVKRQLFFSKKTEPTKTESSMMESIIATTSQTAIQMIVSTAIPLIPCLLVRLFKSPSKPLPQQQQQQEQSYERQSFL